MAAKIPFVKMHTLGNDFMLIDGLRYPQSFGKSEIQCWADRHRGVGFDQLLYAASPEDSQADFFMRIYNADGSQAEQCGNGLRCFYAFVRDRGLTSRDFLCVETPGGLAFVEGGERDDEVTSYLAQPSFNWSDVLVSETAAKQNCSDGTEPERIYFTRQDSESGEELGIAAYPVSVGNPHLIVLVPAGSTPEDMLRQWGKRLSNHPELLRGANVGFAQMKDEENLYLRTYERGSGSTLACGSNSCAAAALMMEKKKAATEMTVRNPGGWAQVGRREGKIYMRSRVQKIYEARLF